MTQEEYDALHNELLKLRLEERLEGKDHAKRIAEIRILLELDAEE